MAKTATAAGTDEQEATEAAVAAPARIAGFAPVEEWRGVVCDGASPWEKLAPRPGAEALWAEVAADLTVAEIRAIPYEEGTPFGDLWPLIIPRVRAWNVRARDLTTGQWVPVPPPVEGGADSMRAAPKLVTQWLAWCLKFGHLGAGSDDLPGKQNGPSGTDGGSGAGD